MYLKESMQISKFFTNGAPRDALVGGERSHHSGIPIWPKCSEKIRLAQRAFSIDYNEVVIYSSRFGLILEYHFLIALWLQS